MADWHGKQNVVAFCIVRDKFLQPLMNINVYIKKINAFKKKLYHRYSKKHLSLVQM